MAAGLTIEAQYFRVLANVSGAFQAEILQQPRDRVADTEARAFRFLAILLELAEDWSLEFRSDRTRLTRLNDLASLAALHELLLGNSAEGAFPTRVLAADPIALLRHHELDALRRSVKAIPYPHRASTIVWVDAEWHVLAEVEYRAGVDSAGIGSSNEIG